MRQGTVVKSLYLNSYHGWEGKGSELYLIFYAARKNTDSNVCKNIRKISRAETETFKSHENIIFIYSFINAINMECITFHMLYLIVSKIGMVPALKEVSI